jgi:hypothetical protein
VSPTAVLGAVAIFTVACSSPNPQHPAMGIDQGEVGSIYAVGTPEGGHLGVVKVFTDGADHYDHGIIDRVAVHVGFWLANESFEALRLEPGFIVVSATFPRNGLRVDLTPTAEDADDLVVLPGQRRQIDTYAYVPVHVLPDHIDAFHVRWAVRGEQSGDFYQQRTPFLAAHDEPRRGRHFTPAIDRVFYGRDELPEMTSLEIP